MGALDAFLIPLFVVFSMFPYLVYWVLRRLSTREEREKLRDWGDPG